MKLQYYLRGLGIGILVTAMIFCILPGEKEVLSDEEVRARAAQLGMVESSSLTLADIQHKQQESAEVQKPEESAKPESTVAPEAVENQGTDEESAEGTEAAQNDDASKASTEEAVKETEATTEVVEITIAGGSSSYTVSKQLQEKQLVEDAGEFDKYLISNGYSRSIRVGTHDIPMGATWEEIAKIISGK